MITEFLMTTRRKQFEAWRRLDQKGYTARCGDANAGPTVIVEHGEADSPSAETIVYSVDQDAQRY